MAISVEPGVVGADGQRDAAADEVGLVAGTEDSTPLQFAVALDEASYLQLDDVVVTVRDLPEGGVWRPAERATRTLSFLSC